MDSHRFTARVFTSGQGLFGNDVLVVAGDGLPDARAREEMARATAAPATVFVDTDRFVARIHNHMVERPFAGHPLLGAATVLRRLGLATDSLRVPAGRVHVWAEADEQWLHAPAEWSPASRHRRAASPVAVDALNGPPADEPVQVWAWIDEPTGQVRARQFAPSEGKPEDEACGSASMLLTAQLGRALTVVHGRGSIIRTRPRAGGVDLGGRCLVVEHAGS